MYTFYPKFKRDNIFLKLSSENSDDDFDYNLKKIKEFGVVNKGGFRNSGIPEFRKVNRKKIPELKFPIPEFRTT